jgi:protocatechuate 3,4-dioxygenase beta subunit
LPGISNIDRKFERNVESNPLRVNGPRSYDRARGGIPSPGLSPFSEKELTEGPYYLDGQYVRSDIREDKTGIPLKLTLTVVDDDTCAPLKNALVEVWQADALGEYSGFVGNNGHDEPDNGTFLRGGVLTDARGVAAGTGAAAYTSTSRSTRT